MTSRRVREPGLGYALTVPMATAAGEPVAVTREDDERGHRFHAASPDQHEVYLEIVAYSGRLDQVAASADQRRSLLARASVASIGAPTEAVLAGRPATALDVDVVLDGQRKVRRFLHVDVGDRTLRIAFDPTSPANLAALDTLELVDRAR